MRRATVGATRRNPSKSVFPSPSGRPKLNVVSPRTSARWRDASARCTTRRNTGVSATAPTSGTRSGRTTRALGTALLVSPVTIWSATTPRTAASSPSEDVTRVANSSSSTSVVSAYHAIAAPASSSAVRTTMTRAAARRMRAPYPAGSGAPSMLPSVSAPISRRGFLAAGALGGAAVLGGGAFALLRDDSRAEAIRAAAAARATVARAGDERRGGVPRQRARRPRGRLPRRSPPAGQPGRHAVVRRFARESLRFAPRASRAAAHGPDAAQHPHGDPRLPGGPLAPGPRLPRIYGWQHIPSAQATLTELFGAAGYRTAMVTDNTWMLKPSWAPFQHMGGLRRRPRPGAAEPARRAVDQPRRRLALPARRPARPVRARRRRPTATSSPATSSTAGDRRQRGGLVRPARLPRGDAVARRNAASTQPFFLFVDSFDPHEPWDPPSKYVERYDDPDPRVKDRSSRSTAATTT